MKNSNKFKGSKKLPKITEFAEYHKENRKKCRGKYKIKHVEWHRKLKNKSKNSPAEIKCTTTTQQTIDNLKRVVADIVHRIRTLKYQTRNKL